MCENEPTWILVKIVNCLNKLQRKKSIFIFNNVFSLPSFHFILVSVLLRQWHPVSKLYSFLFLYPIFVIVIKENYINIEKEMKRLLSVGSGSTLTVIIIIWYLCLLQKLKIISVLKGKCAKKKKKKIMKECYHYFVKRNITEIISFKKLNNIFMFIKFLFLHLYFDNLWHFCF